MASIEHEFPLAEKLTYLNTAGLGLIPASVIRKLLDNCRLVAVKCADVSALG